MTPVQQTAANAHTGWRVGDIEIDITTARVCLRGVPVVVERSGYDLLLHLFEHASEVVIKDELLRVGWPGRVVGENTLAKAISKLRHAIGDDEGELIRVVHGYGYRLSGVVAMTFAPATTTVDDPAAPDAGVVPDSPAVPASRMGAWRPLALVTALMLAVLTVWAWNLRRASGDETQAAVALRPALPGEDVYAVLPFRDASADQALGLLADGFAARIRDHLFRMPKLRAVKPAEADAFRGDGRSFALIGRELRANLIIGGEVSRHGDLLRATLRLHDAKGRVPTAEKIFERTLAEQDTLVEDVSVAVMEAVNREWGMDTRNREAYRAFLRSTVQWAGQKDDAAGERRAIAELEQAVALDPHYATAWFELGNLLGSHGSYADTPEQLAAGRTRALAAVDRAIELAPDPWKHYQRSEFRLLYGHDWDGALEDVEASAAGARNAQAMVLMTWRARIAAYLGFLDEALALDALAVAMDPQTGTRRMMGIHYYLKGDCRNARAMLQLQLQDLPGDSYTTFYLGLCDIQDGRLDEALRQLDESSTSYRLTGTAIVEHLRGDRAASDRALHTLIQRYGDTQARQIAQAYAVRGDKDNAFLWLDRGIRFGDGGMIGIKVDPLLRTLRDDPRFDALLVRLNFPNDPAYLARVTAPLRQVVVASQAR